LEIPRGDRLLSADCPCQEVKIRDLWREIDG
jgi:hypothetical protein